MWEATETYACHGVVVGDYLERFRELYTLHLLPDFADQVFGDVADFMATDSPIIGVGIGRE